MPQRNGGYLAHGVTAVGVGGMVDPAVDQLAVEEE